MPFGNLSIPTQETFVQQQPFQNNNVEMQNTSPQGLLPNKNFSAISTLRQSVTPMSATPAHSAPAVFPAQQSDLEHDVRVYSDSAKMRAFAPQSQHNTSGRIEYPPSQQQVNQPLMPQQRNINGPVEYASPRQQVSQPIMPQQQINNNVQVSYAPTQQHFNQSVPQSAQRNSGLSYVLAVCVGLTALPLPYVVHLLIDSALPMKDNTLVFWLFALALGLLLLQTVLQFVTRAVVASFRRAQTNASNATLYERVLRSPRTLQISTQYILDHLNTLTTAQELVIQTGTSFASASIIAFLFGITLFLVDWRLAGATVLVALLYLYIGSLIGHRYRGASQRVAESHSRVNDTLSQGIAAMRTRNAIPFLDHMVQTTLNEAAQHSYQHAFTGSSIRLAFGVMQSLGGIVLSGLASYLFLTHVITAGQFVAFVLLLLILSVPLSALATLLQQQQAVSAAEASVIEILQ
jgi:ABC-type bacteriocin/lantibiotic exporter with double-glycine peptidase domain